MMYKFFGFLFILSSATHACEGNLKNFKEECQIQDRYRALVNEFNNNSLVPTDLKSYQIQKALGKKDYYSEKNNLLNHTQESLKKNPQWIGHQNGKKFIKTLQSQHLESKDILNLHKAIFKSNPATALRIFEAQTNPSVTISCDDIILNEEVVELISNYDLRSSEKNPLLKIKNPRLCENTKFMSGEIIFYKSSSIISELNTWINDYNDMIVRFENGEVTDLSPYQYLADMRRWFLAIRPFSKGNIEVINHLLDYSTNRLNLAPTFDLDDENSILKSASENQEISLKRIKSSLEYFEGCLYETKANFVSSECTSIR